MRKYNNKEFYKRLAIGILLFTFCFAIGACGIQEDPDSIAIQEGGETSEDDIEKETTNEGKKKIQIYTMDPDSLQAEEIMVEIDAFDGLTAQLIVESVLNLFETQGQEIGVNTIEQDENTVIVDFNGEKAPVATVGSAEETAILDCISMSLLDNLEECQQVVFHVDGESYESGHYGFEFNEAYKWKS